MDLNYLFYPKSVALVGASNKEGSVGFGIAKNLKENFKGTVFFININQETILGDKSYESVLEVNEPIDLVIIAVPAEIVSDVLQDAGKKSVKAAVVISAGFKEAGRYDLEDKLKNIANEYDIALIGPNCLGIINPEINMNASFAALTPEAGSIGFASQSGALCTAVIDYAKYYNIGFSKFVSIGNKSVIDDVTLLEYLFEDEKTKVIALYVESISRPHELINLVKKSRKTNPKPVIVIKSGRTTAGATASQSHTGALAGSDSAYDALFRQAGIIRVGNMEEMFDLARVFINNSIQPTDGVAIITNAGGPGILATDELVANGLKLAELKEETINKLRTIIPPASQGKNPVDVLGDAKADRYGAALETVIKDENVNSLIVILTPQSMTEIKATAQEIARIKKLTEKQIVVTFMGEATVEAGVKVLQKEGVSAVNFPEQAAKSLAIINQYSQNEMDEAEPEFNFPPIDKMLIEEMFSKKKIFPEAEALRIFESYGFPVLNSKVAKNANEAVEISKDFGKNVAMKIVSDDILHKSDVGGVKLDIPMEKVAEVFENMITTVQTKCPNAKLDGILIMEMAPTGGFEFVLGATKDPALGTMVMAGLGGIFVEAIKDVTFGLVPVSKKDARDMLNLIKSKRLFEGVRDLPPLDVEAFVDSIGRMSQLLQDFPNIKEMDINPLLVLPKGRGVILLDGRIILD